MKHFLILSVLLFCSQLTTSAKLRELDQMIEIANRILNEHDSSSSKRLSAERCESSMQKMYETSEICVIGYAMGGFAVVSKDDRFEECLGYSKSSFDVDNVSPEFEWLMQELTNKMSEESSFASKPRKTTEESPAMSIEPLITTQWDQREPYNKLLPEYKGDRCVAGCLATALAQVLYYYKSPTKGKGEMSYTWKINGEEQSVSLNFNDLTFDYDRMLSDYKHGYTDEEANAVAELYLACGVACSTRYTPGQSSAGIAPVSIYKHLSTYIENVTRESSAIINALEHGNPVLCSGNNGQDGHMMIIDGYDAEKGLFHVNFGWGGMSDGYYALDIINGFVPSYCYIVRGLNTTTIENARYITSPYWEGAVFYDFDSQESAERFNVIIPDTITVDGMCYNVNQISTVAFDGKRNINFIRLPEGLTEIPSGGFANCDFKSIYLPTTLKSIKYLGFMNTDADDYYCNAVVPPVDEGAFNYAQLYHATLHVPAELLDAYKDAWGNIRNGVGYRFTIKPMAPADEPMTNVCDDAEIGGIHYKLANTLITNSCQAVVLANPDFSGDIVIPSSVSYNGESYNVGQIAEAAFMDCKELTSVVLPDGLTEIKENTFRNCTKLTSIDIPVGVTIIGDNAFYRCSNLESVTLPEGLISIGELAFGHFNEMKVIELPSTLETLKWGAFMNNRFNTIVCLSVTPPNVKEYGILPMSYVDYTLYVPEESMELYASAEQWSQFAGKIKPLSVYVAVDAPKADVDCVIRNGRVMVSNVSSSDVVEVYSFTGQKLLHVKAVNGRAEFDAPNDHFIVKVGDCALKVQ